nr:uncharacterized protein LOC109150156 isoform X2 [Ipomoea batatas]GMD88004.1 uncharacterized protein LOC109150156 isoform X2 [Ipomoea batatas]
MDSSLMSFEDSTALLCVSLDDYEILPKHMKSLASWEDLLAAVEKINLCLRTKKTKPCAFQLDEVESLGLGMSSFHSRLDSTFGSYSILAVLDLVLDFQF